MSVSLKQILAKDAENAKVREGLNTEILPPGTHVGKLIGFTEEETYQYVTFLIGGKKFNLFYNYFIYGTQDLDREVIEWIKALATISVQDNTDLLTIANSAIGSTYKFEVYNYVSSKGKDEGKTKQAIRFSTKPIRELVTIEEEEVGTEDLPF